MPAGPGAIRVDGKTNLPDGALISLSAARAFRFSHEHDVRAIHAAGVTATVSGGRFSNDLRLNERTLVLDLGFEKDDPQMGPIAVVDSRVTVCADFQTGKDAVNGKPEQPRADVRDAVGDNGERLKNSPQLDVFGSLMPTPSNWLEVKRVVVLKSPLLRRIAAVQGRQPRSARLGGFCLS